MSLKRNQANTGEMTGLKPPAHTEPGSMAETQTSPHVTQEVTLH